MSRNFRNDARLALDRAKAELDTGEDDRLKYAALELRMCMEAITYDRLGAYKGEIAPEDVDTWQPKQVMQILLELDSATEKDATVFVGTEETPGTEAMEMHCLGTDKPLKMQTIKRYYNAIGSFLHTPTYRQLQKGNQSDLVKLRDKCKTLIELIESTLNSPIFNCLVGHMTNISCLRCKAKVVKRLQHGQKEGEAKCIQCGADYVIKLTGDDKVTWEPASFVRCPTENCGEKSYVWKDEVVEGAKWTCPKCKVTYMFGFGLISCP